MVYILLKNDRKEFGGKILISDQSIADLLLWIHLSSKKEVEEIMKASTCLDTFQFAIVDKWMEVLSNPRRICFFFRVGGGVHGALEGIGM